VFAGSDASAGERREACRDADRAAVVPFRDDAGRSAVHAQAFRLPDADPVAASPSEPRDVPAAEALCTPVAVRSAV